MSRTRWRSDFKWWLLALFGFVSSLARYQDLEFNVIAPPLEFPLEMLRANGRPLAIALLVILLLLTFFLNTSPRKMTIPRPIIFLWLVQVAILLKTVQGGDWLAGSIIFAIFSSVVIMHLRGPALWIQDQQSLKKALWAIGLVGVMFVSANFYQATINLRAITFIQGWFHGTTANPHHAGVLMVAVAPSLLALYLLDRGSRLKQLLWFACLILLFIALFRTASRTSFMMFGVVVLCFIRRPLKISNTLFWLGAVILLALFFTFDLSHTLNFADYTSFIDPDNTTLNKLIRGQNTREGLFTSMWNTFLNHPLWGVPIRGGRIRFGESSWLGVASVLGLVGLIPMLLFAWSTLSLVFKINSATFLKTLSTREQIYSNAVTAGLVAMLVGGFTEAFLLANLNFSLYVTLQYIILGNGLIRLKTYRPIDRERIQQLSTSVSYQPYGSS